MPVPVSQHRSPRAQSHRTTKRRTPHLDESLRALSSVAALLAAGVALACSAGEGTTSTAAGSSGNDDASDADDIPFDLDTDRVDTESGGCNEVDISFEGTIPSVVLLVDQSGSMWDSSGTSNYWEQLKPAILNVVSAYDTEVAFKLKTFTAPDNAGPARGATCPMYVESGPPATGSASVIAEKYDGISKLNNSETPTVYALQDAMAELEAVEGNKHIILVTDGQPDYCDDQFNECAARETVGVLQAAYENGIGTTVVGLTNNEDLKENLQRFANAGAGVSVADPANANNTYDHCWQAIYGSTAPMFPPNFTTDGQAATVHIPSAQDTTTLQTAIEGIIKGVKSCTFELEGQLEIIESKADLGKVYLQQGEEETAIPFADADGWVVSGASEVTLQGAACTDLKSDAVSGIRFDFPCDVVVVK